MQPSGSADSDTPLQSHRVTIALLFFVALLLWFSQFIYLPVLPLYLSEKVGNLASVGLILSMFGIAQLALRIPIGLLSDATGRKKGLLIIGFLGMGTGAVLLYYASSTPLLLAARIMTGMGAAVWVLMIAVFTSHFPHHKLVSATALLVIANGAGKTISTFLSGFVNEFLDEAVVFHLGGAAAFAAALLLPFIRIEPMKRAPSSPADFGRLILRRSLLVPTLGHGAAMAAVWAIPLSFLPVRAEELNAGDVETGLLLGAHLAAFTLSNILNSAIGSRVPIRKLIFSASLIFTLGNAVAALADSLAMLVAAGILIGLGFGILMSSFQGSSLRGIPPEQRATAIGIHQSLYSIGIIVGPAVGGVLADAYGLRVMFAVITAAVFLLLMLTLRLTEP